MQLNDSTRRGLRTAIDVLLSAATSGLLLLLVNVFKEPDLTLEQFSTLTATLTPVLSVIKNALEDKFKTSLLVSKRRPEPDQVDAGATDVAIVEPTEEEVFGDAEGLEQPVAHEGGPLSEQVTFGQIPPGMVLVAVEEDEVDPEDLVVGYTR